MEDFSLTSTNWESFYEQKEPIHFLSFDKTSGHPHSMFVFTLIQMVKSFTRFIEND